jgi:hypothetical protein
MGFPNLFHSDNWQINLSNMPSIDQGKIDVHKLYDLYVKSISVPNIDFEVIHSDLRESSSFHPIGRANVDLPNISIEFKADEDLENYYNLYEWIQSLKYGKEVINSETAKGNNIKSIDIMFLDNENRTRGYFRFTNAYITSLGSLNLTQGSSDEVTFPITLNYEEVKLVKLPPAT